MNKGIRSGFLNLLFVLEREESKMKKLFVLFYMIIGVLSIGYVVNAAMNKNINAASSPQYYGVGTYMQKPSNTME